MCACVCVCVAENEEFCLVTPTTHFRPCFQRQVKRFLGSEKLAIK